MHIPTVLCAGVYDDVALGVADYVKTHDAAAQIRSGDFSRLPSMREGARGVIGHFSVRRHIESLAALDLPMVNVSGVLAEPGITSVVADSRAIGELAARHLQAKGYRRFAVVSRNWEHFAVERKEAFESAIRGAGLECHIWTRDALLSDSAIRGEFRRWLAELPKPVGLFATLDDIAMEVVLAAEEEELPVPQDLAVVGVGDTPRICEVLRPTISSVRIPWRLLGYRAAETLYTLIDAGIGYHMDRPRTVLVPPETVIARQSSDTFAVEDEVVRSALRFIAAHVHEQINVGDLLEAVPVSRRVLEVRFREHLGRTPLKEIHRQRIERARQLLIRTDSTVESVALQSGFTNKVRFTDIFKRHTGQPPAEFRSRYQQRSAARGASAE
ncbi:MAG: substrate-binding domain-containing protein [Planctomycetota bacterium]